MKTRALSNRIGDHGWGLLTLGLLLAQACPGTAEIIPADRRMNWQAGVPGGIPTRTNIFCNVRINIPGSSRVAYGDGFRDDSQAITDAINLCPSNQVVYVPAGTYRLMSSIRIFTRSYWTLRGDGPGKTIFIGGGDNIFGFGQVPWMSEWPAPNAILSGAVQGSTNITVAGTTGISVGVLMAIEQPNDGRVVFGYGLGNGSGAINTDDRLNDNTAVLNQRVMVTGLSSNQVTFTPPLNFSFSQALGPTAIGYGGKYGCVFSGLEDLTVNGNSNGEAVSLQGCYGFWLKNVEITGWGTFGLHPQWCSTCEFRHCYFHEPATYGWTRGYAIEFDAVNNTLFEDNVLWHNQSGLMIQGGCSGNVFGYNFALQAYNVYIGINWEGASMEAHTPYPCMNLFEGNYGNGLHFDFYYGPSATTTLLRNCFTGSDPDIQQNRFCVSFDSHQWSNSVVGNILGSVGTNAPFFAAFAGKTITWTNTTPLVWGYDPGNANFPYTSNVIFRLGYPNSGNNASGPPYSDGTTNHLDGYDLLVRSNVLIHGNWDYAHQSITWDPNIPDHVIPTSYYLAGKPSWFGPLPWPPFDPNKPAAATFTNLPAGYRFIFGTNLPVRPANLAPIAVAGATPKSGATPLAVAFSSAGSYDPEGGSLSYFWTFGDGTTSTAANPTNIYRSSGVFAARLTLSDGFNTASSSNVNITVSVPANQPPAAFGQPSTTNGVAPLSVSFSSAGSFDPEGAPLTFGWTFGDGTASSAPHVVHTYRTPGVYAAQLTVSDGTNQTSTGPITITVANAVGGL